MSTTRARSWVKSALDYYRFNVKSIAVRKPNMQWKAGLYGYRTVIVYLEAPCGREVYEDAAALVHRRLIAVHGIVGKSFSTTVNHGNDGLYLRVSVFDRDTEREDAEHDYATRG